jgi:hypothetical protein
MKKIICFLIVGFTVLFSACEISDSNPEPENSDPDPVTGEHLEIIGVLEMNYGPHAITVKGDYAYAARDNIISIISLSDPSNPSVISTFTDTEEGNTFETMFLSGDKLIVGCTGSSSVYVFDVSQPTTPDLLSKFNEPVYEQTRLKPLSLFYHNATLWAGGSDGQSGMLVKFSETNGTLNLENYYRLGGTGNGIQGVWANSDNVFISTADGMVHAFNSDNIAAGELDSYTFGNEAGHEHWGRTLTGKSNMLYWADWGAGFVSLDISDPSNISSEAIITHSVFTGQYPEAEGTNVYDVLIHNTSGKIYLANGWSGLVEIDPANPGQVLNYVDYKDNNYYCIAQYKNYLLLGDIAAGTTDVAGIKIFSLN